MHKIRTLKEVIVFVKLSLLINWFWPLPEDATKRKVLCRKLYQCVSTLVTVIAVITMGYTFLNNLNNPETVVSTGLGFFPCLHIVWNILCHERAYRRLQYVTFEMENFCALMKPHEEAIVQREYINKCVNFYGLSVIASYITVIFSCVLRPPIVHDPLPVIIDFDVYHQPELTVVYIHQTMIGLQIAANLAVNAYMALLLWLLAAKFRLLNEDLRQIMNIYDFVRCIKRHQELLEYAKEVTLIVRLFAIGSVFTSTVTIIICGLICITESTLTLKVQCVVIGISALLEVFMYAWPAEHLIHISIDVEQAALNTDWYNKPIHFRKNLQIVMLRSQQPLIVTLPCGMPSLSLNYYAAYLSTIFSYFSTLRIMFEEEEKEI